MLLLMAPYVSTHSDLLIGTIMGAVPGLSVVCGVALYLITRRESGIRTPKGSVLGFCAGLLVAFAGFIAYRANEWTNYVPGSLAALLILAAGTWLLCEWTAGDRIMAMFRFSWFLLIVGLTVVDSSAYSGRVEVDWYGFSPYPDSGAPALALMLGALLWFPINLLIPFQTALERFHRSGKSDAMDRFLFDAAERKVTLQLTMSDGKFYVGILKQLAPNPIAPGSFVRLLPYASGYRKKETKELVFTTYYVDVYAKLIEEPEFTEEQLDQFIKVLPFSRVISANHFDMHMYIRFQTERKSSKVAAPAPAPAPAPPPPAMGEPPPPMAPA
jgi:hypothetical protein